MTRDLRVAAAALGATLCLLVPIGAFGSAADRSTGKLDPAVFSSASPRAIVSFAHRISDRDIARLRAVGVTKVAVFNAIDAAVVQAPDAAYMHIASWSDVRAVEADAPVVLANNESKKETRVDDVRSGRALRSSYSGAGVTVAVIDSGIDMTHPDLADVVVKHLNFNPSWYMDDITDGEYSRSLAETTGGYDAIGHGTHVGGIVGGTGAAGTGADFSGVAPGATLIDLKIGDFETTELSNDPTDLGAFESNILAAYQWLLDHRDDPAFPGGIRVTNNSWGVALPQGPIAPQDKAVTRIVRAAVRRGVVAVFAAMNEGPAENTVYAGPNGLPEVITVANACKRVESCGEGLIADDSSRGPQIDVAAPGSDIWSALAGADSAAKAARGGLPPPGSTDPAAAARNKSAYVQRSGTSMAAPHVAGIVALMLEAEPALKPAHVRRLLTTTATDRGTAGFDTAWGHGLVDALAAVKAAEAFR